MKLKKGDTVLVIGGDDKGKTGKILKIFPDKNRAIVEGVNFIKRHTRPSTKNPKGGLVEKEASINLTNLKLYCSKCGAHTRVSFKVMEGEGPEKKKVRICRKCGEIL